MNQGEVLNIETLETNLTETTAMEVDNVADTVGNMMRSVILAAMDIFIVAGRELLDLSINVSLMQRDVASVAANSEHEEPTGITTSFGRASD